MDEEELSYEMLQDLLRTERRSNKPTPISPRFWGDVRGFLDELYGTFREEQEKDPFGRKAMLLTDEVKNARHAAEALWALRERKLCMLALAHTDDRQRPKGLTPDERALYDRFLEVLAEARHKALGEAGTPDALAPTTGRPHHGSAPRPKPAEAPSIAAPAAAPEEPAVAPKPATAASRANEAREPATASRHGVAPPSGPAPAGEALPPPVVPSDVAGRDELVTIRALGDIPAFVGPDMQTYRLREGDVATVPPSIAGLLERRKKAVAIPLG